MSTFDREPARRVRDINWYHRVEREEHARQMALERFEARQRRRALLWLPVVALSLPVIVAVAVVESVRERRRT